MSTSKGRIAAAVLLPIGPAAVALLRYVIPYQTADSSEAVVQQIAAEPGRQSAAVWLGLVATLTLVPAVVIICREIRARSSRLTDTAMVLLVGGYLSIGFLVASDAAVLHAVRHDVPVSVAAGLYEQSHPALLVAGGIFVLGHVVGTVLLGIALLRAQVIAAWAAWLVIVSQPLHFVAAVIVGSPELDLLAWGANAVGFAAVSVLMLRTRAPQGTQVLVGAGR